MSLPNAITSSSPTYEDSAQLTVHPSEVHMQQPQVHPEVVAMPIEGQAAQQPQSLPSASTPNMPGEKVIPGPTLLAPPNMPGPTVEGKDDIAFPVKLSAMPSPDVLNTDGASTNESCLMSVMRFLMTYTCCVLSVVIPPCWCCIFRVFNEYEAGIQMRLGQVVQPYKGAGCHYFIPYVDSVVSVDTREKTIDVPGQAMLTRDLVTCRINAVIYYKVKDPLAAVMYVKNYHRATKLLAQTSLRAVVGETLLDDVLQKREKVSVKLRAILDTMTDAWGVDVTMVEIKDIQLPPNMQRAMAAQAEAERIRLGKIIQSEGELEASNTLVEAARTLAGDPTSLTLRYFATLSQIAGKNNNTIVLPVPDKLLAQYSTQCLPRVTVQEVEEEGKKTH
jgi:regulator of protease activity HflC (stomatin/prohibitin superfamily)